MAKNFKRSSTAHLDELSFQDGARVTRWPPLPNNSTVHVIEKIDPSYARGKPISENPIIPPYHWHWYQDEFFTPLKGSFIFTLEGQDIKRSATDGKGVIRIPARARHTFRADPDQDEQVEIEWTTNDEGNVGITEQFFRNLYGYLDDCDKAKCPPSLPQLLMFLDAAEVSLALPGPTFLSHPASWLLGVIGGRWLGWALGYKSTYREYYNPDIRKNI